MQSSPAQTIWTIGQANDDLQEQVRAVNEPVGSRELSRIGRPAWVLFVALNATIFLRPAEIIAALEGASIYEVLILSCIVLRFSGIVHHFSMRSLRENPISWCVAGLLVAVVLADASRLNLYGARHHGVEFLKLVVFYFLFVSMIDSRQRLHQFILWLGVFSVAMTVLALLQYHGAINIASLAAYQQADIDPETGERFFIPRLRSTGIFNDPNDLCLVLNMGMLVCLYQATSPQRGQLIRLLCLGAIPVLGYALALTHSRGGFLAFLASGAAFVVFRFGWRKAMPLALIILPLVFLVFAGRQTSIDTSSGTAQDRVQTWSMGLSILQGHPLFGIGKDNYAEAVGLVAHNSFVHCYVELGLLGGTLFVGAFYFGLVSILQIRREAQEGEAYDPEMVRFIPYLLAILATYVVGFMSLSRPYIVLTYLVLGLITVFIHLTDQSTGVVRQPVMVVDRQLIKKLFLTSFYCLAALYVLIRLLVRWG